MASDDPVFKPSATLVLTYCRGRYLETDAAATRGYRRFDKPGPTTVAACAALTSSLVAHAVVELETQLIELKKQLVQAK